MSEAPNTPEEQFDDAWAQAAQAAEKGEPLPEEPKAEEKPAEEKPAEEPKAEEKPAEEPAKEPAKAGEEKPTEPPKAEEKPAAEEPAKEPEKPAAPKQEEKPLEEAPGKSPAVIEKQPEPAKAPEKSPEQIAEEKRRQDEIEAAIADYKFTDDEQKAIDSFKKEFPDEFHAVEARLKQIDRIITQRVYRAAQGVLEYVESRVAPVARTTEEVARERHMSTVRSAHSDFEVLQPEVKKWIEQQPTYLRKPLEETYARGAAADVVDLYSRFKKETGRDKAPASGAAPAVDPPKKTEPAKPSKDDIDALAPVSGKRTTPSPKGTADPNDYDGAWSEALKNVA